MEKSVLRRLYKNKRKALSKEERIQKSLCIFNNLVHSHLLKQVQNVHIFLSSDKLKEVNTKPIIDYLWSKNISTFIPKVKNQSLITCHYTAETKLIKSRWGLLEPESPKILNEDSIEVVITPLLVCDNKGNRVGYGGGFYDRLFAKCASNTLKIGINFFPPTHEYFPKFSTDIPLDYLITPETIIQF